MSEHLDRINCELPCLIYTWRDITWVSFSLSCLGFISAVHFAISAFTNEFVRSKVFPALELLFGLKAVSAARLSRVLRAKTAYVLVNKRASETLLFVGLNREILGFLGRLRWHEPWLLSLWFVRVGWQTGIIDVQALLNCHGNLSTYWAPAFQVRVDRRILSRGWLKRHWRNTDGRVVLLILG